MKNKKTEPAISKHFSELAQKSWVVRKRKILAKAKAEKIETNHPTRI